MYIATINIVHRDFSSSGLLIGTVQFCIDWSVHNVVIWNTKKVHSVLVYTCVMCPYILDILSSINTFLPLVYKWVESGHLYHILS